MTPDEMEAQSIKYNTQRIVRLSSGALALFGPFSNSTGLPLLTIGTPEEVLPMIQTAEEIREQSDSFCEAAPDPALAEVLSYLFRPEPIRRRI